MKFAASVSLSLLSLNPNMGPLLQTYEDDNPGRVTWNEALDAFMELTKQAAAPRKVSEEMASRHPSEITFGVPQLVVVAP